ncbi:hypothetical protein ACP4OV_008832 [Aristida adscensionis]
MRDAVAKKQGRWLSFLRFFSVLTAVLCAVLLYARHFIVLTAPRYGYRAIDWSSAPNSSDQTASYSNPSAPVLGLKGGGAGGGGGGGAEEDGTGAPVVLDNEVRSPCSPLPKHGICCDRSDHNTDVCFMAGDVRTDPASLSLLLFPPRAPPAPGAAVEERIRPYSRKWERPIMARVPEVRLRLAPPQEAAAGGRRCDVRHDAPVHVVMAGAYTGNLFHAFNDGFLPSWLTVQHLRRRVVLAALSYRPWWGSKFRDIISGLSDHPVIDLLRDNRTHCFPGAIVGTRFHGYLAVDPTRLRDNKTIVDFHRFLAAAHETHGAIINSKPPTETTMLPQPAHRQRRRRRPKLGLVSRRGSRVIENQAAVAQLAAAVGFDVDVLETRGETPLSAVYAAVRACDALVGVHGADLTTFLFLRPGRAALAQIAPLGAAGMSRECFGAPAARMGLHYEQYDVAGYESSLSRVYAPDDAVVADPEKVKRGKGWGFTMRVYLNGQNVTLDLDRFRETLATVHSRLLQRE